MLEAVEKRAQYEEAVWGFMKTAVRDAALKYQTQPSESMSNELPTKFSVQDLEALVLKAVEKKEPNEVRVCNHMLHTDCCMLNTCVPLSFD